MPTITIEEAQTKLRDLIHNLLHGEELVLRTAIASPVWQGESSCLHMRYRSGNWGHISAELY